MRYIIFIIVIGVIFYMLSRKSGRHPLMISDTILEFKSGLLIGIIGAITILLGISFLVFGIYSYLNAYDFTSLVIIELIALLFIGLGLPNLLSGMFYKIRTTENEIIQRTIFNKWKSINWSDVDKVYYFNINRDVVLTGKGIKIYCNRYLTGFPILLKQIELKTGYNVERIGIPVNQRLKEKKDESTTANK